MARGRHALVLMVAAALAACGDEGPAENGNVQALVKDPDAPSSYDGTLSGNINVSISQDGNTWIDLGSANGITIVLQSPTGDSTNVHGQVARSAGNYARVRLTVRDGKATLLSGSRVGNTTLSSTKDITVGGADDLVVIDKSTSFAVVAGTTGRTSIIFDLNSEIWLTESAVQTGQVEDQPIQQAVTVSTRRES